jgi:hypothetical protein
MESIDLFEHYEALPMELQKLLIQFSENNYKKCERLLIESEKLGYTFDYGLDAEPYNLRVLDLSKTLYKEIQYNYIIIKESYPELERESTLSYNKYKKSKKYAFICKGIHNDGSESIYFIDYSNNLAELQERAAGFISWYNYPMNLMKNIQGFISQINN